MGTREISCPEWRSVVLRTTRLHRRAPIQIPHRLARTASFDQTPPSVVRILSRTVPRVHQGSVLVTCHEHGSSTGSCTWPRVVGQSSPPARRDDGFSTGFNAVRGGSARRREPFRILHSHPMKEPDDVGEDGYPCSPWRYALHGHDPAPPRVTHAAEQGRERLEPPYMRQCRTRQTSGARPRKNSIEQEKHTSL